MQMLYMVCRKKTDNLNNLPVFVSYYMADTYLEPGGLVPKPMT